MSADRVLAVDTPPAFSPSLVKELLKAKGSVWNKEASLESVQEQQALQLAVCPHPVPAAPPTPAALIAKGEMNQHKPV